MLKSQTCRAILLPLHRDYLDLIFNSQLCLAVQLALGVHSSFVVIRLNYLPNLFYFPGWISLLSLATTFTIFRFSEIQVNKGLINMGRISFVLLSCLPDKNSTKYMKTSKSYLFLSTVLWNNRTFVLEFLTHNFEHFYC